MNTDPSIFRLLVFDWDGTLMNSAPRIVDSFQRTIAELKLAPRSDQQLAEKIGLGLSEAIRRLYPNENTHIRQALLEGYRHRFKISSIETPLFSGITDLISDLHQQGYILAVATGKSRTGLDRSLQYSALGHYFRILRCSEQTQSKPHPQMLLEIMQVLNIKPEHTLMIGDTEYDLEMANNAGTASLAVDYGSHQRNRLLACQPLDCVSSLEGLPAWLTQYPPV